MPRAESLFLIYLLGYPHLFVILNVLSWGV